jgi:hypothetical protein
MKSAARMITVIGGYETKVLKNAKRSLGKRGGFLYFKRATAQKDLT